MTYERVVVAIKSTGPDPDTHLPVEVAWWDLTTGARGLFVPPHNQQAALGGCDVDTITALGYLTRLAKAPQDEHGEHATQLAKALHGAILVSNSPLTDARLLRRMFDHYLNDFPASMWVLDQPEWFDVLDVRSYAAGVLGLDVTPDLDRICELVGVPLEAAHTAESDVDAIGRCVLRLAEEAAGYTAIQHVPPVRVPQTVPNFPAPAELQDQLVGKLAARVFELVEFPDADNYQVNYGLIATEAENIYLPVLGTATQNLTNCITEINQLNAELDRIRAGVDTAALRDHIADRYRMYRKHAAIGGDDLQAADVAITCFAQILAHQHLQAQELEATRDMLAEYGRDVDRLRVQLAEKQPAVWGDEALRMELAETTPWPELVVPSTELAIGPTTAEPVADRTEHPEANGEPVEVGAEPTSVMAAGPAGVVIGPAHAAQIVADLAATVIADLAVPAAPIEQRLAITPGLTRWYDGYEHGPLRVCPNRRPCGHPGMVHDIEDGDDPIPLCCVQDGLVACPCGRPPAGWRRMPGQRVWQPGDIVPAGAWVLTLDGQVRGDDTGGWVNNLDGPVVEIEAEPASQVASQPDKPDEPDDLAELADEVVASG